MILLLGIRTSTPAAVKTKKEVTVTNPPARTKIGKEDQTRTRAARIRKDLQIRRDQIKIDLTKISIDPKNTKVVRETRMGKGKSPAVVVLTEIRTRVNTNTHRAAEIMMINQGKNS